MRVFVAALVLAIGTSIAGLALWLVGLPLTVTAFVLMWRAMWRLPDGGSIDRWTAAAAIGLSAMCALGLVAPGTGGPLWFEVSRRAFAVVGVACVALFASGDDRWRRRGVLIAVVGGSLIHVLTPLATPHPMIDVFTWTETTTEALLHGIHPYTVTAPDVYHGARNVGFAVVVYPYMPATLLLFAPWAAIFGDYRFALAACLPVTLLLVRATGRRLYAQPELIDAITLAIVLTPGGAILVRSGWNESLMVALAAAFVYAQVRWPGGRLQAIAFCLLPAIKQYFLAPVALYAAIMPRLGRRPLTAGLGAALLTVVPFLLWNWRATLAGIVFQMQAPVGPRLDATSIVSFSASVWGRYPSVWTSVVVQMIVAVVCGAHLRRTGLGGLLLASGVTLTATFLVGWQAFINYYYFVTVLLLLAALTLASPEAA